MDVLVFLVPLALGLGLLGLAAFLWALGNGQYEDLDGAAWRAIMDEDGDMAGADAPAAGQPARGAGATAFSKPMAPGLK
ncbi:Cytochrome oxidase maturation protein cbb3-type [bacterium YEK0313]|nr:Cytochrome oxidase maturation protein cbb3-type [bacterium YEK0313]